MTVTNLLSLKIEKIIRNPNVDLSIEQFGEQLQLSRTHLYRKIKTLTGMSPSMFVSTLRLKVAAELLLDTSLTVSEISYKVGFNNPSYFTSSFKRLYGVAPTDYVIMRKERN
ncbi:MAG: helix-turn-helix domain-containing protein [Mangrovibacterium sp.]